MKKIYLVFLISLASNTLFAQGSLEIVLLDSIKNPVPFQVLSITNNEIGYSKEFASSENGKVQVEALSTSGAYSIEVKESSFYGGKTVTDINLISSKTKTINILLEEKVISLEAVIISAKENLSINSFDAEVASELNVTEIQELPIEGRDVTRALYRLPNITQATGFYPEAPNVAINGANSLYTNYQIDGMDNNENFLGGQRFAMPVGFTKNITALTNNFSAEHGLTSNGIINITTKSGTNEFSGEAFYISRPGPVIDAPSAYAQRDLSGNQVKDGFQRQQFGIGLGGSIVENKTFYFINIERTMDIKDNLLNVPQLGINETVAGINHFTYLSAKIDQQWNSKFRSSLRVNSGLIDIERQGGGLEGGVSFPSTANTQKRNSLNIALKNSYSTDKFTYEGNYLFGRFNWNYADPEYPNSPNVTVLAPDGVTLALLSHPGYVFHETENSHILQQSLTFNQKNHKIKVGLQVKSSSFELFGGGNPNGSYTVQLNQSELDQINALGLGSSLGPENIPSQVQVLNYGVELRPSSFKQSQNIYSLYVQDQWSISSRLNLNLGLRYDYDDLSIGGGTEGDLNNIAPRISANYKLNENLSIRTGYGIYYDKILYAVYSDALQFNSNSSDYKRQLQELIKKGVLPENTDIEKITNAGNLIGSDHNVNYLQGTSASLLQNQREDIFQNELRMLNPNGYDNPYSQQFMLGLQQKLNEKSIFYVDVMHNRSYNLFRVKNLNSPSAYSINPENVNVRSTDQADLDRPIPIESNAAGNYAVIDGDTLTGIARNVIMTESKGRSNYYALNMTLQKEKADDNYSFRLMYTLSFLENNTEDINFRAMDANNFENEWGPSINDRTHLINGIVSYFPIKNLSLTLAILLQSGQPINRIPDATLYGTSDLNGDGRAFGDAYVGNSDRAPGEDRNSDRLPWSNTFDFSVFYKIPLVEKQNVEIGAQVFNVFNAVNLSGYSNNASQSNQIQVGPASSGLIVRRNAAPPRQFQFSLRYLF